MDANETVVEETLKAMQPSPLSGRLLDRLAGAMDEAGSRVEDRPSDRILHPTLNGELADLEETLRELLPHGMPENMIGRLDEAMSRWHEKVPVEEKVVPLIQVTERSSKVSFRPRWRAVAAVALMGVGAAFLTSQNPADPSLTKKRIPVSVEADSTPVVFTPDDARSLVLATNDHGVVWTENGLPVRCLEREVKKEVSFTGERGEQLTIARPVREVMFMVEKLD